MDAIHREFYVGRDFCSVFNVFYLLWVLSRLDSTLNLLNEFLSLPPHTASMIENTVIMDAVVIAQQNPSILFLMLFLDIVSTHVFLSFLNIFRGVPEPSE